MEPVNPAAAQRSESLGERRLVVVSGLSGSGKTVALRTLEDLEYYCVDNLPAELLRELANAVAGGDTPLYPWVAVGIDARNRPEDLYRLPSMLSELAASGFDHRLIYLDARDDILIKRFSDTRRRHPLTAEGLTLADAIAHERKLLKPLTTIADRVLDTSEMNVHQLRRSIATEFGTSQGVLSLLFESFAYKRGVPVDADFVFDARCLPNPHWDARLRPLTGKDMQIREYFADQPTMGEFVDGLRGFLDTWIPRFEADNRSYVTIAVGCTGGRHRSVYIVERLAEHFRQSRDQVLSFHRELE
jgi:UPF0042 nucleotide-binding protein